MKLLTPAAWLLWIASAAFLLYCLYNITTGTTIRSREMTQFVFGALLIVDLIIGVVLYWASTRQQTGVVIVVATLFAFPFASYIVFGVFQRTPRFDPVAELAKSRAFSDPQLQTLAAAIRASDSATLKQALAGKPVPTGTDSAGRDLLHYALRHGTLDCVQVLLDAGANPNSVDPNTERPPLPDQGQHPELVRALVEVGANIEAESDGLTPVVYFTMTRQWDSAIYLVQKGARLDTRDQHGISLNYYLSKWKNDVEGDHPEGWDRLRATITARRQSADSGRLMEDRSPRTEIAHRR